MPKSLARRFILVGLALLVLPSAGQAQHADDSILLGGIPLRLGVGMNETLEELGSVYELRHLDEAPGIWTVFHPSTPTNDVHGMVGTIQFVEGELSFVNKFWHPSVQSPRGLADALYHATRSVTGDGLRTCEVGTTTYEGSPASVRMTCGNRTVEVWLTGAGPRRMVQETLTRR